MHFILFFLASTYLITFLTYYLDDFLTAGPRDSDQCFENMNKVIIIEVFKQLGVPFAPEKIVGPTTCIVYLGIVAIDSIRMKICLPEDKLQDLCWTQKLVGMPKMHQKRSAVFDRKT